LEGVFAMSEIRLRFARGEEVKYISHLDLMRTFERSLRRANLPVSYSKGFNPHPQMVFGLPLAVGVTSGAEYGDFELDKDIPIEEFIIGLNKHLPKGLMVLDASIKKSQGNIMASIAAAAYWIDIHTKTSIDEKKLVEVKNKFLEQEEINVKKEGKKGTKDLNIRPMIIRLEVRKDVLTNPDGDKMPISLAALLNAGSKANLKPELLVTAFCAFSGIELRYANIHRTALYIEKGGKLIEPLDFEKYKVIDDDK
jgi:radical SAM-linked protein